MKTITAYKRSIEEAKRFVYQANKAIKSLEADEYAKYGNKNVASAKRASMDLTRILVEIRKPFTS